MTSDLLFSSMGWAGFILLTGSYILVTLGVLDLKARYYPMISGTGALFAILSSWYIGSYEVVVLNIIWVGISIAGALGKTINSPLKSLKQFYGYYLAIGLLIFAYQYSTEETLIKTLMDTGGALGIYTYIAAYFLGTQKIITDKFFYFLNVKGAIIYLPILWFDKNYPFFCVEFVGMLFSIYGYYKANQENTEKSENVL